MMCEAQAAGGPMLGSPRQEPPEDELVTVVTSCAMPVEVAHNVSRRYRQCFRTTRGRCFSLSISPSQKLYNNALPLVLLRSGSGATLIPLPRIIPQGARYRCHGYEAWASTPRRPRCGCGPWPRTVVHVGIHPLGYGRACLVEDQDQRRGKCIPLTWKERPER